jgi:DNA-binding response OmpR family regulator
MTSTKGTIFYVEDDKFLADLLKAKLVSTGYEVHYYDEGQKAYDALDTVEADSFVIDLLLPNVDGFQIIEKIRSMDAHKEKAIWVFSNYGDQESIDKAFSAGADKYLVKSSFVPDELIAEMEGYVREKK